MFLFLKKQHSVAAVLFTPTGLVLVNLPRKKQSREKYLADSEKT